MSNESRHPLQGHGLKFWTLAILLPAVSFLLCWGLYEAVIRYAHYLLGSVISLLLLAAATGPLYSTAFERRERLDVLIQAKNDPTLTSAKRKLLEDQLKVMNFVVAMSTTVAAILVLITMFAWVSYAIVQLGLGVPATASPATYADLVKTYAWHLVDLVPFMHAEKSLGLPSPPVEFRGWATGGPVLAFRVLVGVIGFTAIRRAWTEFVPHDATSDSRTGASA